MTVVTDERHMRLPVYEKLLDEVKGIVHVKDVLAALGEGLPSTTCVTKIMREALFVPENKPISGVLQEFQTKREQMAIVVDEYGGVDGLVTVEDLLEEIVGEIFESGENGTEPLVKQEEGWFLVDGKCNLRTLEDALECDLPEGEYDTVAGWMVTRLGRFPETGATEFMDELEVKVVDADGRRVKRLRVRKKDRPGELSPLKDDVKETK